VGQLQAQSFTSASNVAVVLERRVPNPHHSGVNREFEQYVALGVEPESQGTHARTLLLPGMATRGPSRTVSGVDSVPSASFVQRWVARASARVSEEPVCALAAATVSCALYIV
jgi:hypothetical protein